MPNIITVGEEYVPFEQIAYPPSRARHGSGRRLAPRHRLCLIERVQGETRIQ
jgi:hypothetical protein